jgi:cysteine desulfurase
MVRAEPVARSAKFDNNQMMDVIYLDNNATTKPSAEVVAGMVPYLEEFYGNPSSIHRFGQRARQAMDEARGQVAGLVGCSEAELMFSGGGTESINTAIRGLLSVRSPRKKIVTSTVEHSATRELCQQLGREGFEIESIEVDVGGTLDMDRLKSVVDDSVALVSIMWANNETGVIFPVQQIAEICKSHRVPFHCDAVQAAAKIPVNFHEAGVDVASIAAHKFHGPKGVAAMYIRRGVRLRPLLIGGPQERGRRGGTENVPGIVGMGIAADLGRQSLSKADQIARLRDRLEEGILSKIDQTAVNGRTDLRVPNTTNIGFSRLEAEAILLLLSEQGICASAGAACSSGSLEPSPVLRAMRIDEKIAHGAIRFSLSRYTTEAEIDRALEVLPGVIGKLRAVLPVG